jgi:hypothetical protein
MEEIEGGSRKMVHRSLRVKTFSLALALLTIAATAPFAPAETVAGAPLGTIITGGSVTVGNVSAPTGTTFFAGDKVASIQPAMINFNGGSRIEMTKAAATFSREGKTIVVQTDQGLLRFNFQKGESVRINAGKFQFAGGNNSSRVGELGVNRNGQLVMTLTEGSFEALNTETGARTEVTAAKPLTVTNQVPAVAAGAGTATTAGSAITAGIVAGVAGGVGVGVGIYESAKSPN